MKIDFASDVDKALYIVYNALSKSKREPEFLSWLSSLGYTQAEMKAEGKKIKDELKKQVQKHPDFPGWSKWSQMTGTLKISKTASGPSKKPTNENTMTNLEKYIKQQIKEAKQVRLQEANADAEKKLKDLIAKGVSQNNEELEEEFPSGIGSKASHDAVHMTNPHAFKGLERTINNIADTLTTGVADLLNISPDIASNVILAAVPASVIVGLAAGAAEALDRDWETHEG